MACFSRAAANALRRTHRGFVGLHDVATLSQQSRQSLNIIKLSKNEFPNYDDIKSELLQSGHILLRGAEFSSQQELNEKYSYLIGSDCSELSLRNHIFNPVFKSKASQLSVCQLYTEMSFYDNWSSNVLFGCIQLPSRSYHISISNNHRITNELPETLYQRFQKLGIRYNTVIDKPITISDDDNKTVSHSNNCAMEYSASLKICYHRPAFVKHPQTGEEIFFNELSSQRSEESKHLRWYATYGDGTPFSPLEIGMLHLAYDKNTIQMDGNWKAGDILLLEHHHTSYDRTLAGVSDPKSIAALQSSPVARIVGDDPKQLGGTSKCQFS